MVKRFTVGIITGFTLAEVLVTLTIIGVIAALTIPALLQNIQDAQYKTACKREYSVIDQAAKMIMLDNGGTAKGLCDNANYVIRSRCIRDQFLQRMSFIKKCSSSPEQDSFGTCFVTPSWLGGPWKNLDGGDSGFGADASAMLNDGTSLLFYHASADCSYLGTRACTRILYDINGLKPPNITGKDIFVVWLFDDGIKPYGVAGQPAVTYSGAERTILYLKQ